MHRSIPNALVTAGVAAALLFTAAPHPAHAQTAAKLDDPTIVAIFDAANTWDMETGALAAKRGRSAEVRSFGAMLVKAHRGVRQEGRDLARKLKVTPTPPKNFAMAADHAAAMRKLRSLKGRAFDRAFLAHEAAYHKAVIDAVTGTLLPALQNAEVKKLVTDVAPAFQAHMMQAQSMLEHYPR
jgi:putative membrane protein